MFKNIGYVLNVKDVLSDAHNTFMKSVAEHKESEQQQINEILSKDKAFNWSDEDNMDDDKEQGQEKIIKKHKYAPQRSSLGAITSKVIGLAVEQASVSGRNSTGSINTYK